MMNNDDSLYIFYELQCGVVCFYLSCSVSENNHGYLQEIRKLPSQQTTLL